MAHSNMEPTPRSQRPPRRTQRLLPALTPAPPSSSTAPPSAKLEQLASSSESLRAAAPAKKPSSIVHIFFNRRPLDLIRRTTSSLLASGTSGAASVNVSEPVAEERKFWQPHRPHGEKNGRRRLQQLQQREKDRVKEEPKPRRPRAELGEADGDKRKRQEQSSDSFDTARRRPAPCPPTGEQFLQSAQADELTPLECVEILQHDEIRFVSTLAVKRRRRNGRIQNDLPVHPDDAPAQVEEPEDGPVGLCNDGYDDEHGDYLVLMGDHLAFRYEVLHALGQGSFGQVVCCLDHRTRKQVAVKIIRSRRKYRDQALVEVQLLAQLQRGVADCIDNPHIVRMEEYFVFRDHVCIAFEVLGTNLYDFLKLRYFHGLPMNSVQRVGKQLAQALAFLMKQQVVHCDLKPENVLLDASALEGDARNTGIVDNVTLIDFGSSCMEGAPMFTYIQSRFYRSPEVLLGHPYESAIDMWSFACILVELHTGHPIFAGENEREQLACIMEVLGVPPADMLRNSKRRLNFFDEVVNPVDIDAMNFAPKPFVNSRGRRRIPGSRSLTTAVKSEDLEFLDFLTKCFVWDPSQRLTPQQALQEPWLCHHVHEQPLNHVEYEL